MLEPLYIKTIEQKEEINQFFNDIQNNLNTKKIKEAYIEYKFTKEKQDKTFAAIDGSFNKKKFMAYFIYAVDSQTIISKPQQGIIKESATGNINIESTIISRTIDSRLSKHMNILELKSTIDTLQKHPEIDYMLMDGSIRGTLMNFSTNYNLDKNIINYLNNKSREIELTLNKKNFPIEVSTITMEQEIKQEIKDLLKQNNSHIDIKEVEQDILRYFEGLEQLECISYLLKKYGEKIISISKTSSTKDLFKERIPDAAAIEYTCKNPGFTKPHHEKNNKLVRSRIEGGKLLVNYPRHTTELTGYTYTVLFTRLDEKSNVLKIELPYEIPHDNYSKIKTILNDLYSTCINGYPYILKKAHEEVVITNEDMQRIINKLEIFEKTGRDMLN